MAIKSLLRKITRRELSDVLKETSRKLEKGVTVELPENYSCFNGKIARTVHTNEVQVTYIYDDNGLLEQKSFIGNMNRYDVLYEPHGSFTGKKVGRKLSTLQRGAAMFGVFAAITSGLYLPTLIPPTIEYRRWQKFNAKDNGYRIEINITAHGDKYTNLTFLSQEDSEKNPLNITGHDYDFDGRWDAIIMRKKRLDGYSSVRFADGRVVWEPCSSDKRTGLKPFSPQEIAIARNLLDDAQKHISDENRTSNWSVEVELE